MRKALLWTLSLVSLVAAADAAPVTLRNPNFDSVRKTYVPEYGNGADLTSVTVTAAGYGYANFGDGKWFSGSGFTSNWSDSTSNSSGIAASTWYTTPTGWLGSTADQTGYEALGLNYLALKPGASAADLAGFMTASQSITQLIIGVTIQANTKYTLTYLLGTRNGTPPTNPGYLRGTTVKLTADAGSNPAPTNGNWAAQSLIFDTSNVLNSPLVGESLTVGFASGASGNILVDNVALNASPIPEPTGIAAIILGSVAMLRRRCHV